MTLARELGDVIIERRDANRMRPATNIQKRKTTRFIKTPGATTYILLRVQRRYAGGENEKLYSGHESCL
jgi:hypothetical protein